MFEFNFQQSYPLQPGHFSGNNHTHQYNIALNLFKSAVLKGKFSRIKNGIFNHRQWLYDLVSLKSCIALQGSFYSGIKVVDISSIVGTEGRVADFDINFYPASEKSRERWVGMALAYLSRIPLPPVELIQVADRYFVRDGHHRISVARSLGQTAMDAEVTTWKTHSPLPWRCCAQLHPVQCIIAVNRHKPQASQ